MRIIQIFKKIILIFVEIIKNSLDFPTKKEYTILVSLFFWRISILNMRGKNYE